MQSAQIFKFENQQQTEFIVCSRAKKQKRIMRAGEGAQFWITARFWITAAIMFSDSCLRIYFISSFLTHWLIDHGFSKHLIYPFSFVFQSLHLIWHLLNLSCRTPSPWFSGLFTAGEEDSELPKVLLKVLFWALLKVILLGKVLFKVLKKVL